MALVKQMTIFLALTSLLLTDAAIPLITVKENCGYGEDQFVLNPEAISMIKSLSSPVKVIAAIGDARVGKSTAINFILWKQILGDVSMYGPEQGRKIELSEEEFEQVEKLRFKTGHTMEAETRGVWVSFLTIPSGLGDLILLDVQGTDLGDDTVTDKLTMFATLMSSCLMLFMKEHPTNHITDFVYKIARKTDITFSKEDTKYPPHLMVILRGALNPPQGYRNIDDYVKDSLIKPYFEGQLQEKRRVIRKRFSAEQITVFNLPYVCSPGIKSLRDTSLICDSIPDYCQFIEDVTSQLMKVPVKKIAHTDNVGGGLFSREPKQLTLGDLAEKLVKVLNDKIRWKYLDSNFYHISIEEDACANSWHEYIKPLLDSTNSMTAANFEDEKKHALRSFNERCVIKGKPEAAENELQSVLQRIRCREEDGYVMATIQWIMNNPWIKIIIGLFVIFILDQVYRHRRPLTQRDSW